MTAIRPFGEPLREGGAFGVVRGSLAPDGAVIKTSAASDRLLRHQGPAIVFRGYHDMLARIDDPELADHAGQRAGAGGLRSGRRPRHARVGHDPDPGPARRGRRHRHGARHRRADERHQLRHGDLARRPGGGRRRPAGPGRDGDLITIDVDSRAAATWNCPRTRLGTRTVKATSKCPRIERSTARLAGTLRTARHPGAVRL